MTFAEFQELLEGGTVPPVVVFHGDEPFLARVGVDLLKRRLIAPGAEPFDLLSVSGGETTAEAIVTHAGTLPMLSERRLVVVYEFERLGPRERTKLLSYMAAPVGGACVALVSFGRISGAARFEREVLASAAAVGCDRPEETALEALVRRMASERGVGVDDAALEALVDWTRGDLTRIANEIEKLAAFVGARARIGLDDVDSVVGAKASSLSDLFLAIAERRVGRALLVLEELREGGLEGAELVSQLYAFWVSLWLARAGGAAAGFRGRAVASTGVSLEGLSRERTSREYARGVERFLRADVDIRRGMAPSPIVALLVYDLTAGGTGLGSGPIGS